MDPLDPLSVTCPPDRFRYLQALFRAGEWKAAELLAEELLLSHPDVPIFWIAMADAIARPPGDSGMAARFLSRKSRRWVADSMIDYCAAWHFSRAGDDDSALASLERAIRLNPELTGVWRHDPELFRLAIYYDGPADLEWN